MQRERKLLIPLREVRKKEYNAKNIKYGTI